MKTFSRLALAVLLTGAVSLPVFAQDGETGPARKHQVIRVAAGPEVAKHEAGKTENGKPAGITEGTGSHAPATPPAATAVPPKTN